MDITFSTYLNHIRIQHNYPLCHMASVLQLSMPEMADIELGRAPAPNIERITLIMATLNLSEMERDLLVEKAVFS